MRLNFIISNIGLICTVRLNLKHERSFCGYRLLALLTKDDLHNKAKRLTTELSDRQIVTSEMIFTEVLNSLSKQKEHTHQKASKLIQKARPSLGIIVISQTSELFENALELYIDRLDKAWSLTDCASFWIMQQRGIQEALAYDKHFEQAGFAALLRDS